MENTIEIEYDDQNVTVTYDCWKAYPQTLEEPGCDAGLEVECVENDHGVMMDLTQDEYDDIAALVGEYLESDRQAALEAKWEADREDGIVGI